MTVIKNNYSENSLYREHFETDSESINLKVYIKSKTEVYDVPIIGGAVIEKEEFCAGKFTFRVVKDIVMSFNQGDAVSVKYNDEGVFYGYVFSKSRDKDGVIKVICYDQMRYLKNRRTYTRGKMKLDEIVKKIANDNALRIADTDSGGGLLPAVAAENVSLLDVVKKACTLERQLYGKRFILYDDFGFLKLKNEDALTVNVMIDESTAENFVYSDNIDGNVYNHVELYADTKRLNLRKITTVRDENTIDEWGELILSKKASDPERAYEEGQNLLKEYNRIQREIVLKGINGDIRFIPGCSVWVTMTMGDLYFDGYVRVKKVLHNFEGNRYWVSLYLDGSEAE